MLDLGDGIYLLSDFFQGGSTLLCPSAADGNDDGVLDVADAVFIIFYQFLEGDPPPAPFPGCGDDPTEDSLSCNIYNGC